MKQVWICGDCSYTNESFEAVSKHEGNCQFNPKIKGCYSCDNLKEEGFNGVLNEVCSKYHELSAFDDGECPDWIIETSK